MEYWQAQEKAEKLLAAGNPEQSLAYFELALQSIPEDYQRKYAVISIYLGKAQSLLALGRAHAAMETVEALQRDDIAGVYQNYPEYYDLIKACERQLGMDTRNHENMHTELGLNWREALSRAQRLLEQGRYRESLAYFERCLMDSPGEWYSSVEEKQAEQGRAEALRMLESSKNKRNRNP